MRSDYKKARTYVIITIFILFSYTFSFAQYEGIKGVQLTDESVVYGRVTKINADNIQMETKEGQIITIKCNKIRNFMMMDFFSGIKFKDGSIIYGTVIELDINKVIIMTKYSEVVTRKFNDIDSFIKEDIKEISKHFFTLGTEVSYIKYEEPGYMEDKGTMYGIVGLYAYHDKRMVIKLEGKFSYGQVDYDGAYWNGTPLTMSGISDYMLELRWLLGYDFVAKAITITPNLGMGYRYLQDNSQDKSDGGYQRESNYIYIPIGIETVANLGNGWSLGTNIEYDLFLWGRQISYFNDIDPNYSAVENEQMQGYGVRGSISIAKKGKKVDFIIEPFIRYWNIKESREGYIIHQGVPVGYGIEPNNDSTEIGCRLAVTF
jgi:hypothetical protein